MIGTLKHRDLVKRTSALLLSSCALVVAGCGIGSSAPEGNSFVANAAFSGKAMGGQQPILGATVNLYTVGTSGYGSAATLLATTTTTAGGNFSFNTVTTQTGASSPASATYGCPSNSALVYMTVSGGDPTNTNGSNSNAAIKLVDALGSCSSIATAFYVVNEVSSAVTLAALQQYISPVNESIGAPSTTSASSNMSTAATGISNAFALVQNIIQQSAGQVYATYAPGSSAGAVTATPEISKINTIADVLAACVNTTSSSSGACTALFSAATPPPVPSATNFASSYTPAIVPQDTLQAGLFMMVNPNNAGTQVTTCNGASATSNTACLYSLVGSTPPFVALTAAPTDWTVGVTYASTSTQTVGGATVGYLNEPEYLAVDKSGNVWVNNYIVPTGSGYGNGLTELSAQGGIVQQVLTGQNQLNGPRIPVIDPAGNVWSPNLGSNTASNALGYATTVVEFPVNGSSTAGNLYNVAGGPFGLASDGAGNIFVAETTKAVTGATGNGTPGADVEEITAGAVAGSTATVISPSGSGYAASIYASIAVDSLFRPWVTSDSTTVSVFVPPTSGTTYSYLSTNSGVTDSVGIAIDNSNNAWVSNYATSAAKLDEFSISGGAIVADTGSPFSGAGLTKSQYTAIDGAGNTWTTGQSSAAGSVIEVANTGAALSPTNGYPHTYDYPAGIAVDPSGNVWVGSEAKDTFGVTAAGTNGPGGSGAGAFVTEILGAAVPVVTPIAAGLPTTAGGASKLASPPQ